MSAETENGEGEPHDVEDTSGRPTLEKIGDAKVVNTYRYDEELGEMSRSEAGPNGVVDVSYNRYRCSACRSDIDLVAEATVIDELASGDRDEGEEHLREHFEGEALTRTADSIVGYDMVGLIDGARYLEAGDRVRLVFRSGRSGNRREMIATVEEGQGGRPGYLETRYAFTDVYDPAENKDRSDLVTEWGYYDDLEMYEAMTTDKEVVVYTVRSDGVESKIGVLDSITLLGRTRPWDRYPDDEDVVGLIDE